MKRFLSTLAVIAAIIIPGAIAVGAAAPAVFRPDAGTMFTETALTHHISNTAEVQIPTSATAPTAATDGFELVKGPSRLFDLFVEVMTSPITAANDAGVCQPSTGVDKDANAGFADNTLETAPLYAYIYNPAKAKWFRAPSLDQIVIGGSTTWAKVGIAAPSDVSRIAYVPPTTNVCPKKIYIVARR